jgi:hypothetical protein
VADNRAQFGGALLALLLAASPALAHPGVGIVMDRQGNIFYTDLEQVWKISPAGRKSIAVRNVHTHELYLDARGNLYGEHLWYEGEATNRWGHRVWRLAPDGTVSDVVAALTGFRDDYDDFHFVRDAAGAMYWADRGEPTVIRKRAADGRVHLLAAGFRDVGWMAVTPDGAVFLTDGADLRRIGLDGAVRTLARGLREHRLLQVEVEDRHSLMGIWLDAAGNCYVAGYGAGVVKRVTPAGLVSIVARTRWPWSPTGGLVAPNGDLWLLEYRLPGAVRVRRIRADGTTRTF